MSKAVQRVRAMLNRRDSYSSANNGISAEMRAPEKRLLISKSVINIYGKDVRLTESEWKAALKLRDRIFKRVQTENEAEIERIDSILEQVLTADSEAKE